MCVGLMKTMKCFTRLTGALHTIFYKKLRSGLRTESFLASLNFEYSKFLNSFLTFFYKHRQEMNFKGVIHCYCILIEIRSEFVDLIG